MKSLNDIVSAALDSGAAKAAVISGSSIVLSESFYELCKSNACGNFGRCWMCPPDIAPIRTLMERVRSYPRGLLYQSISPLEDSFDIEGMEAAARGHAMLSQRIDRIVKPMVGDCFHLSCGGCNLCPECAKRTGEPCRFEDRALLSMEGAGIDVYNTVKDTQLKYINGPNTVTYFGLLLFGEREDA